MFAHSLVYALVVATDEDQLMLGRQRLGHRLTQEAAARRKKDTGCRAGEGQRLDGGEYRLRLHHHARATAKRIIVRDLVAANAELAQIDERQVDDPSLDGTGDHTLFQPAGEKPGEEGDDEKPHASDAGCRLRRLVTRHVPGPMTRSRCGPRQRLCWPPRL